jgi:hypothetical protein
MVAIMAVGKANLAIYEGDDFSDTITVVNPDGTTPDLTGCEAQAQIRLGPADQNPIVVVEIGITIMPPNQILLAIPNATTALMSGRYQWDLQVTATDGTIRTVVAGAVVVTPDITRQGGAKKT